MSSMKLSTAIMALLMAVLILAIKTGAYSVSLKTKKIPLTTLNAWTLPKPTNKNPFETFKPSSFSASWYDDHNPTARKVIYNDFDHDEIFHFAVSFQSDDWISPPYESAPRINETTTRRPLRLFAGKVYKSFKILTRKVDKDTI